MFEWNADDENDRWIYRTIYPKEMNNASQRLIQFKYMLEVDAEADWNFDENVDYEETNQPIIMSQRRTLIDPFPKGLSFFSFAKYHLNVLTCTDLPEQAEMGDHFAVLVENNDSISNSKIYKEILKRRTQPKKIHNAAGAEVILKAFICFKANSELLTEPILSIIEQLLLLMVCLSIVKFVEMVIALARSLLHSPLSIICSVSECIASDCAQQRNLGDYLLTLTDMFIAWLVFYIEASTLTVVNKILRI